MPPEFVPLYPRPGRPILIPVERLRRGSMRNVLIAVLLVLALLVLLAPRAEALDWKTVASDSGELILKAPDLSHFPHRVERAEEGWNLYELATWEAANQDLPRAELILIKKRKIAPSNIHFIKSVRLTDLAQKSFPAERLTMGRSYVAENLLGDIEVQHFMSSDGKACAYVEQGISTFSDSIDFDSGATLLGNIIIRGWYCVKADEPQADDKLASFVRGVGLKGFADPRKK